MMVRLTLIASLGCLLSISNNMIKMEVYSAPSSGFLMLLNGTTATKPNPRNCFNSSLSLSTYISKSCQVHPTNVPQIHLSQKLLHQPPNWSPYFHFYPSYPHCTCSGSLLHITSIVILKTQNQIMSLSCLKLSNISPSYCEYNPPSLWPTEHSVMRPCPSGHIVALSPLPVLLSSAALLVSQSPLPQEHSVFAGMLFLQNLAWLAPFTYQSSAHMLLPQKMVPYSIAALLPLETRHHMTRMYYLHSTYHY